MRLFVSDSFRASHDAACPPRGLGVRRARAASVSESSRSVGGLWPRLSGFADECAQDPRHLGIAGSWWVKGFQIRQNSSCAEPAGSRPFLCRARDRGINTSVEPPESPGTRVKTTHHISTGSRPPPRGHLLERSSRTRLEVWIMRIQVMFLVVFVDGTPEPRVQLRGLREVTVSGWLPQPGPATRHQYEKDHGGHRVPRNLPSEIAAAPPGEHRSDRQADEHNGYENEVGHDLGEAAQQPPGARPSGPAEQWLSRESRTCR